LTDFNLHACFVRQFLKLKLPQSIAMAIAATGIRSDQQASWSSITFWPQFMPAAPNRFDGKLGGVTADSH
jgi:hypothetical protein